MDDLIYFADLVEKFLLASGFTPEDIALLKEIPFESVAQIDQVLKELKENVEKK